MDMRIRCPGNNKQPNWYYKSTNHQRYKSKFRFSNIIVFRSKATYPLSIKYGDIKQVDTIPQPNQGTTFLAHL